MGNARGTGTRAILLAAFTGFAAMAHAACNGPQALVSQLKTHPTTSKAIVLGSWYASHNQFECATSVFQSALKLDPKSAQLHYLNGLARLGAHQPEKALPDIAASIRLDPEVLKPHLLLASVLDALGRHAEAETEWRKSLSIDPKSEQALDGLSADMMARKDYAGTVQLLESAPRTEKLTIRMAQALGLLNYYDEAGKVLLQAMQEHKDSLPLADAMVVVLVKQAKYEEAINLFQYMTKKHPGNLDAELQLFRLLVLTNHIEQALPIGPKLLAARPHDPDVLYLNGVVQRMMGNYPQAKTYLEEAVALEPNFFASRYNLGMVLVFLKQWQLAKEQLQKAIELGTPQPEVHFELSKALRGLGDTQSAMREIQIYQQQKKTADAVGQAAASARQADANADAGKLDDAIREYQDAIQAKPDVALYHYKFALALQRKGDEAGGRRELEEAVRLDPKLPGAQNALGIVLSRAGEADAAVEHFRLAVEGAPEWTEAWINLAAQLAMTRHFAEAKQAVARALALDPANAEARELSQQLAKDPAAQNQP